MHFITDKLTRRGRHWRRTHDVVPDALFARLRSLPEDPYRLDAMLVAAESTIRFVFGRSSQRFVWTPDSLAMTESRYSEAYAALLAFYASVTVYLAENRAELTLASHLRNEVKNLAETISALTEEDAVVSLFLMRLEDEVKWPETYRMTGTLYGLLSDSFGLPKCDAAAQITIGSVATNNLATTMHACSEADTYGLERASFIRLLRRDIRRG